MFKHLAIATCLSLAHLGIGHAASIYVWRDDSGVKHFSEICPPDEKCRLREVSKRRKDKLLYGSPAESGPGISDSASTATEGTDSTDSNVAVGDTSAPSSTDGGSGNSPAPSDSVTSSPSGSTATASAPTVTFETGYVAEAGVLAPPSSSSYAYNTFKPGAANFPAVGKTYGDPVLGGTVRRLTDRGSAGSDDMYAHHWANANGSYAFQNSGGVGRVISTTTGAVQWSGAQVPRGSIGYEMAWDAVDPNAYYFYSGASLMRRNLVTQTSTTMHTFPSNLQANGGSLNTQSADGRYFTVRYGGSNKVWDSVTNTVYAGSVPPLKSTGWVAITPDGNFLVTAAGSSPSPQIEHYSYAIDHATKTISSTPTQFWGLCGDHGVLVSASDGKNYYVSFNCHATNPGVYRVDITLDQAGRSEAQQLAANKLLIPLDWSDNDGHLSAVSKGPLRDWVFFSSENAGDGYNSSISGWKAHRQEIIAMNVLSGEVRRMAHHRSRGLGDGSYWNQPRISCSWDGSVVLWNSNYNVNSPSGYADIYAINYPLGATTP